MPASARRVFASGFIVCKKAGSCIRSHNPGSAIFQQKPDERAEQSSTVKGVRMVDDKVARFCQSKGLSLDLRGVREERFVTKSLKSANH